MLESVESEVRDAVTGVNADEDSVRNVQDPTQLDNNHVVRESTRHIQTKQPRPKKKSLKTPKTKCYQGR